MIYYRRADQWQNPGETKRDRDTSEPSFIYARIYT